jgi:hypothetical protein
VALERVFVVVQEAVALDGGELVEIRRQHDRRDLEAQGVRPGERRIRGARRMCASSG